MKRYHVAIIKRSNLATKLGTAVGITDAAGGSMGARFRPRPQYTPDEAQEVADWLNGQDRPLVTMVQPGWDEWNPLYRQGKRRRIALNVRGGTRRGLLPLPADLPKA